MEKSSGEFRRNNKGCKMLPCSTPVTTSTSLFRQPSTTYNVLWSVWQKLCQYRQHITSNTHRAEPTEPINLHDPGLLPTLQCTLQCMGHARKCTKGTQTFPISKLGGWKPTTAFHKSSKTNRHQELKHLRQYWWYRNRSVIGNRGGWWTFLNLGDIDLSPASLETTETNKRPKHYSKTAAIT